MKKKPIVGIVIVAFVFSMVGCQSQSFEFSPENVSDIANMEAFLETREWGEVRFEILPEDYERVIRLFQHREIEKAPHAAWVAMGSLKVTDHKGRTTGIAIFRTFQDIGAFRIHNRRFRGSSDETILSTFADCAKRAGATKK